MTDAATIAKGLTKAQREALLILTGGDWSTAGTAIYLSTGRIATKREQRAFSVGMGNMPELVERSQAMSSKLGAMGLRLTPLGLTVRAYLQETDR